MGNSKVYLFFILLGSLFFIPFLGNVHLFDWDEVNFAEISREMIVTNDFLRVQVNFQPFWEKPPLFFWIQVISMKLFGINEFAARFPNAIVGIITLLVLYRMGSFLINKRFGFIWSMAYFGSILPHLYFKSGIIDPLFNLFIFSGIYYFLKFKWKQENIVELTLTKSPIFYLILSGFFIGLAILTKGPVAYLIFLLVLIVYWISARFKLFISIPKFILVSFIASAVMLIWFGIETLKHGPDFVIEFVTYQIRLFSTEDAGHGGFPGFHVIVLLFGCFPASIFAIRGFYKLQLEKKYQQDFRKWMMILFWVVLGLFTIVQSKIVHYSSLAYFPVTFLAALVINGILDKTISFNKWMKFGIISIGLIFSVLTIAVPFIGQNIELLKPLFENNPDGLASLNANGNWTGWEAITGVLIVIVISLFLLYIWKDKVYKAFKFLFLGMACVVFIGLVFFIGRVEMYSQNANVEFCKSLVGKEGYIATSGFKSYVPLFYSQRQPSNNPKSSDIGYLTWEEVDIEVYIIGKKHLEEYWLGVHTVEQIGGKNGFVFFKRKSTKNDL